MTLRDEMIEAGAKALFKDRGWTFEWDHPVLDAKRPIGEGTMRESFLKTSEVMLDAVLDVWVETWGPK